MEQSPWPPLWPATQPGFPDSRGAELNPPYGIKAYGKEAVNSLGDKVGAKNLQEDKNAAEHYGIAIVEVALCRRMGAGTHISAYVKQRIIEWLGFTQPLTEQDQAEVERAYEIRMFLRAEAISNALKSAEEPKESK